MIFIFIWHWCQTRFFRWTEKSICFAFVTREINRWQCLTMKSFDQSWKDKITKQCAQQRDLIRAMWFSWSSTSSIEWWHLPSKLKTKFRKSICLLLWVCDVCFQARPWEDLFLSLFFAHLTRSRLALSEVKSATTTTKWKSARISLEERKRDEIDNYSESERTRRGRTRDKLRCRIGKKPDEK